MPGRSSKALLPGYILAVHAVIRSSFISAVFLALIESANPSEKAETPETLIKRASDLLRSGESRKAAVSFQEILVSSQKSGDHRSVARASVGLAASYVVTHEYKRALHEGESALRYGIARQDADIAVRAALNLSTVYRRMGDFAAATQVVRELNPILPRVTDPMVRAGLYLHAGTLASHGQDRNRAESLFFAGIDAALMANDIQLAASGWNQLGYMRLAANDLPGAEAALTEAFRLRRSAGNRNLGTSYVYLGRLRLQQGDAQSAVNLLNRAVEVSAGASGDTSHPLTILLYWRATAKLRLSNVTGALADFDRAVRQATEWRQDILPSDGVRISFEVGLDRIYEDYVDAGMSEWRRTRDMAMARRMFEVSEQHKLASFRETRRSAVPLDAEYWETLQKYRAALGSAWSTGKAAPPDGSRLALIRMESRLGVAPLDEMAVRAPQIQKSLGPDEALLSFQTGRERSWAWAVTREAIEVAEIPSVEKLRAMSKAFRDGMRTSSAAELHGALFGTFTPRIHRKRDWLLSLDDTLFDIPMAALGPEHDPLVASHSTRSIPGAALLTRARRIPSNTRFVAAADAIYNSADPRWNGPSVVGAVGFSRLLNTAVEAGAVTRAWPADRNPTLLLGQNFTRMSLDRAIDTRPAVVHLAGHVVAHHSDTSQVMIGLGLGKDGKPDFLTPSDIAAKQVEVGLVSVNGCASGSGASPPGAGLVGLTRAWLAAGAESVAATYWPVEDDRGALFSRLYAELGRGPVSPSRAARALQAAQLAARARNAAPKTWAAVFLVSKN
jgi:CHAT domain-containing protein/tetratricopeptide (TPR) repeat protein